MSSDLKSVELRAGTGRLHAHEIGDGTPIVLLHGGTAGRAIYAGTSEIWRSLAVSLSRTHRVIAIDLPGTGRTLATSFSDLTVAGGVTLIETALQEYGIHRTHLVAHSDASVLALRLARSARMETLSCVLIAGHQAAPIGDGVQDVALLNPPQRHRAAWVLDRLSYSTQYIDDTLLDALEGSWRAEAHRRALELLAQPGFAGRLLADLHAEKALLHEYCREVGFSLPISLIWGADDPTTSKAHAYELMKVLSRAEAHLNLSYVNRAGHFPFLEAEREVERLMRAVIDVAE